MEHYFCLNRKGQSSIEFILLVSIAMIYISTIILPSVEVSKRATDDIMQLSQARLAAEKLANSIDYVAAASGDAKTTITIIVPARAQVKCVCNSASTVPCDGKVNAVSFDFWLTENNQTPLLENPACPKEAIDPYKSICSKQFLAISNFNCKDATGAAKDSIGDPAIGIQTIAEISIEKTTSGATSEINVTIQ